MKKKAPAKTRASKTPTSKASRKGQGKQSFHLDPTTTPPASTPQATGASLHISPKTTPGKKKRQSPAKSGAAKKTERELLFPKHRRKKADESSQGVDLVNIEQALNDMRPLNRGIILNALHSLNEVISLAKSEAKNNSMPERFRFRKSTETPGIIALCDISAKAITELNNIALSHTEAVLPISRKSIVWPCLLGRSEESRNSWKEHLEALQVAEENPVAKTPSEKTPINEIARKYLVRLLGQWNLETKILRLPEAQRSEIGRLPAFTKKTARKWAKLAEEMIRDDNDGDLGANPILTAKGEHRRRHSEYTGAQSIATTATGRANVIDGGRESLRLSFVRWAREEGE